MNKIKAFIGMAATAALLITAGCGTVPPGGGTPGGTNNQAVIDGVAIILRGAARDGTLAAITPPSGNTNNVVYFKLAANALGEFVTGKNYSPAALQAALMGLNVPQLNDPYVRIGIGTVIDLYQFYYGLYIGPDLSANANVAAAVEFITAIQDGINEALGVPPPNMGTRTARAPGYYNGCLPRPITPIKSSK